MTTCHKLANATQRQISLIRGRRYNRAEKKQGKRTDLTSGQNVQKSTTAQVLAKEHNVDEKTIRRDGKFAEAVEALDMEDEIVAGEVSAPKAESLKRAAQTVNVYSRIGIGKNGPPKSNGDKLSLNRASASDGGDNRDS